MSRARRIWTAGGLLAVQFVVLYAPSSPGVATGGLPWDKAIHVLVFALPTWALIRAGLPVRWVVAGMIGHAFASEVIQAVLLADRAGDPRDVVADVTGVIVGWAAWRASARPRRTRAEATARTVGVG